MLRTTLGALVTASALALTGAVAHAQDAQGRAHRQDAHDASQAVSELRTQVSDLPSEPPDPAHPAEVRALRTLARALDQMPGRCSGCKQAAQAVREDAEQIQKTGPKSATHADSAKDALSRTLDALGSMEGQAGVSPALADRIAAARSTIDQIDTHVLFLEQRQVIDQAFVQVAEALAAAQAPEVSTAEEQERQNVVGREPRQKPWYMQYAVEGGGGYASFGAKGLRDITQNGGAWDFRFVLGARSPLAVELAYVGTANQLNGRLPNVDSSAVLTSNAFEGDLRLATPTYHHIPVQLFGFAGAGYNHFDLINKFFNNSELADNDTTFVLPAGGGLQLNLTSHLTVDGRFTYRAMFDENLLGRNHNADMYTATGRVGYVF
jgi:opacity protein-like surface antigen